MDEEVKKLTAKVENQKQIIAFQLQIIKHLADFTIKRNKAFSKLIDCLEFMETKYPDEMRELAERLKIDPEENLFSAIAFELILQQKEFSPKLGNDEIRALVAEGGKEINPTLNDVDAFNWIARSLLYYDPEIIKTFPVLGTTHEADTLKSSISRGRNRMKKLRKRNRN